MNSAVDPSTIRKPIIHHIHELQKRLTWSILAVLAGAFVAYGVHDWLLMLIQKPLGQTLYYTSPMGGFNFLLKLCLAVGFVLALPIILYQIFSFLGPLLKRHHRLTIVAYALWSFDLAYCGLVFAYFISLPSALHFLSQFGGNTVQSLITVDEYFNFALAYLAGFALIFQVPLFVLFINRIKPLKPSKMMSAQRYIILGSFIAAAILTPTPDPLNQAIMALPAILLYQVGVVLVWVANRPKKKAKPMRTLQTQSVARKKATVIDHKPKESISEVPKPQQVFTVTKLPASTPAKTYDVKPMRRVTRKTVDGFAIRVNSVQPSDQSAPIKPTSVDSLIS